MSVAPRFIRANVRIEILREYHVGAGHGRGAELDSVLFTDFQGDAEEPAIRYGHGVLRQAVYDLLQAPPLAGLRHCKASGDTAGPEWCAGRGDEPIICPVCRIFGSPALPSPWSFSTLRPESADRSPGARVVSRASADPRRRRAADRTLFSEELGAPLTFTLAAERSAGDVEEGLDELALLAAATRAVPAVGADRRRGRGECRIDVGAEGGPGADDLLNRFRDAWLADGDVAPRAAAARRPGRPSVAAGEVRPSLWTEAEEAEEWLEVQLVVRLDEPVIAGSRPLTGNVLQSELYIPGGMLLGALAGRALAAGAAEDAFLRVFRAGCVRFPDLLPVDERGAEFVPTLPAPRDLYTCTRKRGPTATGGHGVWSALLRDGGGPACARCREAGTPDAKPERLKDFLLPLPVEASEQTPYFLKLKSREETKIQVDPRTGRVRERNLYHRQTIPAGTLLAGMLLATPAALDDLRGWLGAGTDPIELRLGKRHGRGYGAARLSWLEADPGDVEKRRAAVRRRVEALVNTGLPIPLVARSRVLLRDGLGRVRQSLSPEVLGLPGKGDCAVVARQVGGYWRHIGLPRQQEQALEPGSVIMVTPGEVDRDRLLEGLVALAEGRAVGERTTEGFGRFNVAPFPYGWNDEQSASDDPDFQPRPIPENLRPRDASKEGPLRRDRRAELALEYEAELRSAGIDPERDEWRTVARLLYARAGDEAEPLLNAMEKGSGRPEDELKKAGAAREAKSFLTAGAGKDAWPNVRRLVEKAAAGTLAEEVRALHTRALADALAQVVHPRKGRE